MHLSLQFIINNSKREMKPQAGICSKVAESCQGRKFKQLGECRLKCKE
jgi:hypothetical protein